MARHLGCWLSAGSKLMHPYPLDEYEFEDFENVRAMARMMDDEPQDNPQPPPEPPAKTLPSSPGAADIIGAENENQSLYHLRGAEPRKDL
jgi:hypothetical protein